MENKIRWVAEAYNKDAENVCKRPQDTAYECDYIDGLLEAKKLIIDCQYVGEDKRLWKP